LGRFVPALYVNDLAPARVSAAEFAEYKQAYIAWMEQHLEALRKANMCCQGNLNATDVAQKFGEVCSRLTNKIVPLADIYLFEGTFDNEQMAVIFSLLDRMVEASARSSDRGAFEAGSSAAAQFRRAQQNLQSL
jgi:hypothetical protein